MMKDNIIYNALQPSRMTMMCSYKRTELK